MENSFLNSIISSALSAQDAQYSSESGSSYAAESSITDRDGYVGEMVKASLAIMEDRKPIDYSTPFDSNCIVLLNSLSVTIQGTDMEVHVEPTSLDSLEELIHYVEEQISLDLDKIQAYYMKDTDKVYMTQDSEYGTVEVIAKIEVYQKTDTNKTLRLPLKA